MDKIKEIGRKLSTQDNLATAHPMYTVQQRRDVYGMDPEWSDEIVWIWDHDVVAESEEDLDKFLKEKSLTLEDAEDSGFLVRTGKFSYWEFVQAFFTLDAAEAFVLAQAHNLREPRVYVESGHRNPEWKLLRRFLKEYSEDK